MIRCFTFVAIGVIAVLVPSVGENRFVIGGVLAFGIPPLILALNLWDRQHRFEWLDVLIDVLAVVVVAQFVPQYWNIILLIGAIIVLSPASVFGKEQWKISFGAYWLLIPGMAIAGWRHDVEDWVLSLVVLLCLVPTTLYYAKWRAEREDDLREEAAKVDSLKLISGGVAHDFNNILAGVVGHAEYALDELGPEHPRGSRSRAWSALPCARRCARPAATFSGGQLRSPRPVDVARELRTAIETLEPLLPRDTRVELEADDPLPKVVGDAGQLQQVFLNLLVNAAEASSPGEVITLRARLDPIASRLRCTVSDQGTGIAPEHLKRLFDPFFSTKTRGHGLGARQRRAHSRGAPGSDQRREHRRHRNALHRRPAGGLRAGDGRRHPTPPPVTDSSMRTALVVDDDEVVRLVTGRILRSAGWQVMTASDGEEGLHCWRANRSVIDLVFLDLKMPRLDGYGCPEAHPRGGRRRAGARHQRFRSRRRRGRRPRRGPARRRSPSPSGANSSTKRSRPRPAAAG